MSRDPENKTSEAAVGCAKNSPVPDAEQLKQEELTIRKKNVHGLSSTVVYRFIVNLYSAVFVVLVYLISLESLLSITLSVSMTIYTYNNTVRKRSYVDM
jgi:hypothetical protein